MEPIGYLGIQEETTFLGIPCFTLRDNTERPITIERGTNVLLGLAPERIGEVPALIGERGRRVVEPPPRWDGHAAERIVEVLARAELPAVEPQAV
jgi:UDP-N-acetylglucosamine 2-epimerase (non-hydrolysing)